VNASRLPVTNLLDERIGDNALIYDPWKIAGLNPVFEDLLSLCKPSISAVAGH
jgi:hypothetical protein